MRRRLVAAIVAAIVVGAMAVACAGVFVDRAGASVGIVPGSFHAEALNSDGSPDTVAGSHPYEYRASFEFDHDQNGSPEESARNVLVSVPAGFVGNPTVMPRCPRQDVEGQLANCPPDTQIGTLSSVLAEPGGVQLAPAAGGLYNLAPPKGAAASFGFQAAGFNVIENATLIPGGKGGYRVAVSANVPKNYLLFATQTIWGVPADESHDGERECITSEDEHVTPCSIELAPRPFLTLPTNCEPQLPAELAVEFVETPGEYFKEIAAQPQLKGCGALDFKPAITVQPETSEAATPTGLRVDVHMPQEETPEGLAEADLKNAVVTLPQGVVVNPAEANGLTGCGTAQIGLGSTTPAACPAASKIGTVEVDTPLVDHPLPGTIYLASQGDNPFHSLLALYVMIEDPITGVVVKLAGHVEPDPVTGQLTTRFDENPQFPFEDFKLDITGAAHLPLITPDTCGTKQATADFSPWSSPEGKDATPYVEPFAIASGVHGGACAYTAAQEPHAPGFQAGTTFTNAGAYTPFGLKLTREDGSQPFHKLDVTLPPGLTGKLAGLARCSDAQIAAAQAPGRTGAQEQASPSCPATTEVGAVEAAAGAGNDPVRVSGHAYLAGPYEGAPFSIAIVTPAVAGPFDLGVVVVRSALYINPLNAQVMVKSDPIPTILDGIPLDIRSLVVDVNRNQFTLNPTSCERMAVEGSETSALEQVARLSNPFQAGGCQGLLFQPVFQVSTSAKASKANGASLTTRVSFPHEAQSLGQGSEANIAKVRVELPKQLPSRLTTLQKACTEQQFNRNPAGCPSSSVVGHAVAHTPILSVPLEGPAYFVSHGNAAFPELIMVLQGEGVTIQLNGETDIKHGITSSTFNQIPDAPVENFVLNLPEGPYSALSAPGGHLCEQDLIMPTRLTGQNGAILTQNTHIEVEGCPTTLAITHHKIDKRTLTLTLYVPAAGEVTLAGKGLRSKTETTTGRQTITLDLTQKHAGRLHTELHIAYTPKHGKRQAKSLGLRFKQ